MRLFRHSVVHTRLWITVWIEPCTLVGKTVDNSVDTVSLHVSMRGPTQLDRPSRRPVDPSSRESAAFRQMLSESAKLSPA